MASTRTDGSNGFVHANVRAPASQIDIGLAHAVPRPSGRAQCGRHRRRNACRQQPATAFVNFWTRQSCPPFSVIKVDAGGQDRTSSHWKVKMRFFYACVGRQNGGPAAGQAGAHGTVTCLLTVSGQTTRPVTVFAALRGWVNRRQIRRFLSSSEKRLSVLGWCKTDGQRSPSGASEAPESDQVPAQVSWPWTQP